MDYQAEYRSKLRTPAEAVRAVKDGDWVDYTSGLGFPPLLDAALAARRDELHDVKVRGNLCMGPLQIVECDPEQTHFLYHTWHCSAYERRLCDRGLCYFTPMIFRNLAWYYRQFLTVNVAMACVTPMDRHGYFNLSAATGVSRAILEQADIVILEINEHLPRLRGGFDEVIHISDVDMIVEGAHAPFSDPPEHPASAEDTAIANLLLPHICDGATVQLGIGGMPTVLGKLLARSGLHDLGMHTELCSDAYLELHEAGVLTNRRCTLHRNQGMLGITIGSQRLYDWVDDNPGVIAAPLSYVNAPEVIHLHPADGRGHPGIPARKNVSGAAGGLRGEVFPGLSNSINARRRTESPSGAVQLVQKPRRVSPPERRKKVRSFSQATCAAKKIPLGLQTCVPAASGGQRVRCSQAAHPLVKK